MVMTRTGERETRTLLASTILVKPCSQISRTHPIYERAWMLVVNSPTSCGTISLPQQTPLVLIGHSMGGLVIKKVRIWKSSSIFTEFITEVGL